MMRDKRIRAVLALAGAVLFASSLAARAETFPNHPLRLIVPYAAGGGTDAVARLVAKGMEQKLGQPVVVENNGTGGGNLASQLAASAAPDGHTILMANQGPMVVNPYLFKKLAVDPLTAFEPVTLIARTPLVLVVPKASKFKSFADLIAFGRANAGALTYGSAGNGSASHLATEMLLKQAAIQAVHVPYKGASPALTDLLGGRSDFMVTTLPSVLGFITSGEMIPLAVTSRDRVAKLLPDVPTIAESGFPEHESAAWYGFVVPKGTPASVIGILHEAAVSALATPQIRERLESEGSTIVGDRPEQFGAMMKAEAARWKAFLAGAGISAD
jgi:tripartite-type tricarboxylate transporter receptor subunit TctC